MLDAGAVFPVLVVENATEMAVGNAIPFVGFRRFAAAPIGMPKDMNGGVVPKVTLAAKALNN